MGANAGQTMMGLAKGGLTGLGQGLQAQQNPMAQPNFGQLQQGFNNFRAQQKKKPPLQTGINGNQNPFPSGPDTSLYG
jgi:hypothetical protein